MELLNHRTTELPNRLLPGWAFCALMGMLLTNGVFAQTDTLYMKTYGGESRDECYDHIRTSDGGYMLVGTVWEMGNGRLDMWMLKLDEDGDSLWSNTFGDWDRERAYKVFQTEDDGYILFGTTNSHTDDEENYDALIVRTDEDGDSLWSRRYGSDERDEIFDAVEFDGGYALAGRTRGFDAWSYDFWLLMVDEEGDSLTARTYSGEGFDVCESIIRTSDGGFALAGYTSGFQNADTDFLQINVDDAGDSLWSFKWGRSDEFLRCRTTLELRDGVFVMSGRVHWQGRSTGQVVSVCFNEDDRLWELRYGDFTQHHYKSVLASVITSNNNILMSGYFTDQLEVLKVDEQGQVVYGQYFNTNYQPVIHSLIIDDDETFSMAGFQEFPEEEGGEDFLFVKLRSDTLDAISFDNRFSSTDDFHLFPAYPNPFNHNFQVPFGLKPHSKGIISIHSISGQRLINIPISVNSGGVGQINVNTNDWVAGTYIVRLSSDDKIESDSQNLSTAKITLIR